MPASARRPVKPPHEAGADPQVAAQGHRATITGFIESALAGQGALHAAARAG